jgi:hypothetical protein
MVIGAGTILSSCFSVVAFFMPEQGQSHYSQNLICCQKTGVEERI